MAPLIINGKVLCSGIMFQQNQPGFGFLRLLPLQDKNIPLPVFINYPFTTFFVIIYARGNTSLQVRPGQTLNRAEL